MIESSSNMVVESGGNLRRRGGGAVTLEEVGLDDEGLRERRIEYDEKKGSGIQRFYRLDGSEDACCLAANEENTRLRGGHSQVWSCLHNSI